MDVLSFVVGSLVGGALWAAMAARKPAQGSDVQAVANVLLSLFREESSSSHASRTVVSELSAIARAIEQSRSVDGVTDGQRVANVLEHTLVRDDNRYTTNAADGLFAIARAVDRLTEAAARRA